MKKSLYTLLITLTSFICYAQPSNDECSAPFAIPNIVQWCGNFSNLNATKSVISTDPDIQQPFCWNNDAGDVWFTFQTSVGVRDVVIKINGIGAAPLSTPQASVYRGTCVFEDLTPINCGSVVSGNALTLNALALDPNTTYFIRINHSGTSANAGDFELCVEQYVPDIVISDNGNSTLCSGKLFDSGGKLGNYANDQNIVYTIKPNSTHSCIKLKVVKYDIESNFDFLRIYDGVAVNANLIGELSGLGGNIELQASSGTVTIEFESDNIVNKAGFELQWECSQEPCTPELPIVVNPDVNLQALIEALASPQVKIQNPVLNCPNGAFASFQTQGVNKLGIEKGIVLSNGLAKNAEGPNDDNGFNDGYDFMAPGDLQLDTMPDNVDLQTSQDACVLEFDVFAATDELTFNYVFGSEEYPEFAPPNDVFNDVFAFFITGPGFTQPTNIAVLPVAGSPATSINNVNAVTNNQFYVDNAAGKSVEYNAFTTVLEAKAKVIPCNYYHLKLAIADRNDGILDSGVFIADLKAGTPKFITDFDVISNENVMVESCSRDSLSIRVKNQSPQSNTFSIEFTSFGASNNVDVQQIPTSITLPANVTEVKFPLVTIADNLTEGDESFALKMYSNYGCGKILLDSIYITIKDKIEVEIPQDTFYVCPQSQVQLFAYGASTFAWSPIIELNSPSIYNPIATPSESRWYTVAGSIKGLNNICIGRDSAFVRVVKPNVSILPNQSTLQICLPDTQTPIRLEASNNTLNNGLVWTTNNSTFTSTNPVINVLPNQSTTYYANVNIAGCAAADTLHLRVDDLPNLNLMLDIPALDIRTNNPDTTVICQSETLYLTSPTYSGFAGIKHSWLINGQATNPATTTLNIAHAPTQTSTYTRKTENGLCKSTQSTTVLVDNSVVQATSDVSIICKGQTVQLVASGSKDYSWTPSNSLSNANIANPIATPSETTTYLVTGINKNGCERSAEVLVEVIKCIVETANVFTPNGDGVNETFGPIFEAPIEILDFKVFDRWGELVFADKNGRWDGKLNDKDLPSDVYVFFIRAKFPDGTTKEYKGDVSLMR